MTFDRHKFKSYRGICFNKGKVGVKAVVYRKNNFDQEYVTFNEI